MVVRFLILIIILSTSTFAKRSDDPIKIINKSIETLRTMHGDSEYADMVRKLETAKGILIIPNYIRGGFIVGAESGSGVLSLKNELGWSPPCFINYSSGSLGIQLGVQASELVFLLMTQKAVDSFLNNKMTMGVDVSVAFGSKGTTVGKAKGPTLDGDIFYYAKTQGLFAGGSLKGGGVSTLHDLNGQFYIDSNFPSPRNILIERTCHNHNEHLLINALQSYAP